jgi:hypothetical protein
MLIKFICNNPECDNNTSKFFKSYTDIPPFLDCGACGTGKLEREFSFPSSKSTVVVDNGFQQKAVEILSEVVEEQRKKVDRDQT